MGRPSTRKPGRRSRSVSEDDQPLAGVDTHAQPHLSNNNGRCLAVAWLFRGIPRFLVRIIDRQDARF